MLEIKIPGYGDLKLAELVLDYNGTLARDGELIAGVEDRLKTLSARFQIHVLTADTFGKASPESDIYPASSLFSVQAIRSKRSPTS